LEPGIVYFLSNRSLIFSTYPSSMSRLLLIAGYVEPLNPGAFKNNLPDRGDKRSGIWGFDKICRIEPVPVVLGKVVGVDHLLQLRDIRASCFRIPVEKRDLFKSVVRFFPHLPEILIGLHSGYGVEVVLDGACKMIVLSHIDRPAVPALPGHYSVFVG